MLLSSDGKQKIMSKLIYFLVGFQRAKYRNSVSEFTTNPTHLMAIFNGIQSKNMSSKIKS